jgi:hypothetical protein
MQVKYSFGFDRRGHSLFASENHSDHFLCTAGAHYDTVSTADRTLRLVHAVFSDNVIAGWTITGRNPEAINHGCIAPSYVCGQAVGMHDLFVMGAANEKKCQDGSVHSGSNK